LFAHGRAGGCSEPPPAQWETRDERDTTAAQAGEHDENDGADEHDDPRRRLTIEVHRSTFPGNLGSAGRLMAARRVVKPAAPFLPFYPPPSHLLRIAAGWH
jgi:hypothetical protein